MSKLDFIISSLCVIVLSFIMGLEIGKKYPLKPPRIEPIEKVDTLVIRDTMMQYEPIYKERVKLEQVLVPVTDSVMIHDTLFVYLDREQVTWRDSLCEVYASGIKTTVDSVRHFTSKEVVTIEKTIPVKVKSKWGIGLQTGYGVTDGGLFPYIGVGVSYNILSW